MSVRIEVPPITEIRTGDGALRNRRVSPLDHSTPHYLLFSGKKFIRVRDYI